MTFAELSDSIMSATGIQPGDFTMKETGGVVSITYGPSVTQTQKNQAAALIAAWVSPSEAQENKDLARLLLDSTPEPMARLARAVSLVTLDEINLLRQWITSFKAAVAAASSLADLKTRVAALSNTPDRTPAQLRNAVRNRIETSDAD